MFLRILLCCLIVGMFFSCKKDNAESPANQAPAVSIDWGKQPNNVSVIGTYSDPDGTVAALKFVIYKDGQLWKSNVVSGVPASPMDFYNVLDLNSSAGTYTVYLEATDNRNSTTRSNGLIMTFQ